MDVECVSNHSSTDRSPYMVFYIWTVVTCDSDSEQTVMLTLHELEKFDSCLNK